MVEGHLEAITIKDLRLTEAIVVVTEAGDSRGNIQTIIIKVTISIYISHDTWAKGTFHIVVQRTLHTHMCDSFKAEATSGLRHHIPVQRTHIQVLV